MIIIEGWIRKEILRLCENKNGEYEVVVKNFKMRVRVSGEKEKEVEMTSISPKD